jgi:hypothetical protein
MINFESNDNANIAISSEGYNHRRGVPIPF